MSNAHCTECSECDLILPDAILENITHLTSMLYLPQSGQVGRVNTNYDTVVHRFHHGQPQHDWVLEIARSTLADLEQKHLSVHAHQFQITSVNDAPPLYPPGQNHFGCKAYNFKDGRYFGRGIMATITVLPQEELPTAQTIHSYDSQATPRWTSLKNWLLTTFKKDDEMMGIHLYDLQGALLSKMLLLNLAHPAIGRWTPLASDFGTTQGRVKPFTSHTVSPTTSKPRIGLSRGGSNATTTSLTQIYL